MSQMQTVVDTWPPNIEAIRAVLPVTDRNIFAYDHVIFNPSGGKLPPELHAHELVHFGQQDEIGVEVWWDRFLAEPQFRLEQEIPAHKAEYHAYRLYHKDRNDHARMLRALGKRLSAPMYGGIITTNEAMKAIR